MKWRRYIFWRKKRLEPAAAKHDGHMRKQIREMVQKNLYFLQQDRMERELFHSCVLLKNLALIHQELPMTADFLLEQLMDAGRPLRNVYADILSLYRRGEQDAAFRILPQRVPVKAATDFARILSKLDCIEPSELVMQMDGFEETFSAERKTKAMARAERKSLVTTLTSTATVFVVLLNFTVVVIFLDTLQILGQLF
ncbi:MAG: hypothetical protein IKJ77_02210 [Firmicutes bacterium]|nr:hypothetical protein [Bacillota bacterium]